MADDTDDRPAEPRKAKEPKPRFKERDDTNEEDDDRPRKKRRAAEGEDEPRPNDRRDDAPPKRKRRVSDDADRGPRVKSNEGPPVLMLLALIGSAVGLLAVCVGCGWWSWVWLVGGGDFGGVNELEVVSASRQSPLTPFDSPRVQWEVKALRDTSTKDGQYYLVMKCGTQEVTKPLSPGGKGWSASGGGPELGLKGSSGPLEVWVEKRRTQVAKDGTVVSNVYKVP